MSEVFGENLSTRTGMLYMRNDIKSWRRRRDYLFHVQIWQETNGYFSLICEYATSEA